MLTDPIKFGPHTVPGIWQHLLPYEALTWRIPDERRSTCGNCPRIGSDDYRPDYRCCTYHPKVPNYMLGLGIDDPRTANLITQVAKDGWLLPDGFQATPSQWVSFLIDVADDTFGKSQKVLCPFLDQANGNCGIYAYRNSVCSTFFCITDHGAAGRKFWDGMQSLVTQVELALSQWALQQSGFDVESYFERLDSLSNHMKKVTASKKSGRAWSKYARQILWGEGFGHELEIYRSCAKVIEGNLERLWDIANSIDIKEGLKFEAATQTLVPSTYRDEIDDPIDATDDQSDRTTEPPYRLWAQVKKLYQKMWSLPDGALQLSQKVSVRPADSPVSPNDQQPIGLSGDPWGQSYVVTFYHGTKKKKLKATEPIGRAEGEALQFFQQLRSLNATTIATVGTISGRDPIAFITEWTNRKVLTQQRVPCGSRL